MAPVKKVLKNGETRWKDRVWITDDAGKRQRVQLTAPTKGELERLVDGLREKSRKAKLGLAEPEKPAPKTISYDDLCELMLSRWMRREQSKRALVNSLVPSRRHFGEWNVREIGRDDVEAWFSSLTGRNGRRLAPTTLRNYLRAMRQICNYGIPRGYMEANPTHGVTLPDGHEGTDAADPFESWEEVRAVAQMLGRAYPLGEALVMFVCATGLRFEEWSALYWSDLDLSVPQVHLWRTNVDGQLEKRGKTKGSLAPVLLPAVAVEAIRSLPTPLDRNSLLFPNPKGELWSADVFQKDFWKPAMLASGVSATGHPSTCGTRSRHSRWPRRSRSNGSASRCGTPTSRPPAGTTRGGFAGPRRTGSAS